MPLHVYSLKSLMNIPTTIHEDNHGAIELSKNSKVSQQNETHRYLAPFYSGENLLK